MTRLALVTTCALSFVASPSSGQLRPEPDSLNQASPDLVERLRRDAFAYFRFVNRPWTARVCHDFSADLPTLPVVRLHGDAHLEQFAFTNDAWGLDDFDDAAKGPALVDAVRMLGSIELAIRLRGWTRQRGVLFDRFFQGYRRGLSDPDYLPPPPTIVTRLRAQPSRTREAFLAWGETQMQPLTDAEKDAVVSSVEAFSRLIHGEKPDLAPGYLNVVHAGWLRLGVGSALSRKILIRLQGPSPDPADDELIEAKEARELDGLACLEDPPSQPTLRIIVGTRDLGRLKHTILAAGPDFVIPERLARPQRLRAWWIRSWDPSYREIQLADLRSATELAEIAYDAGAQLGGGSLRDDSVAHGNERKQALASVNRLEKRIRSEASDLVDQLLIGWRELAAR